MNKLLGLYSRSATRRLIASGMMIGAVLLLTGCEVGPNFHPPKQMIPKTFSPSAMQPTTAKPAEAGGMAAEKAARKAGMVSFVIDTKPAHLAHWWQSFHDPVLNRLIAMAARQNLSLAQARQAIIQAREVLNSTAANLGPFVSAVGSYSHSRGSKNLIRGHTSTGPSESDNYSAGLDGTWELDFFGQIRRGIQAARASLHEAIDNRRVILITLLSEVASDYINLRGIQAQIAITENNLQTQDRTVALLKQQVGGGISTELSVAQAQAQAATTASQLPVLETQAHQLSYAIAVLLSMPPGTLDKLLDAPKPIPPVPPEVPIGLPGQLLLRRPDVRVALDQYAAAVANVGVAEGNLYPKFTISANLGYSAATAEQWFNTASLAYGIGPSVSWSILNWGQVQSQIGQQKAVALQALFNYRQTVIQALDDVDSALVAYTREQAHYRALAAAVEQNQRAVKLSIELYRNGLTDFLNVLTAQQSLYTSQDALIQSQQAISADLVTLYQALGGGWQTRAHESAAKH
ncbi:MAG: efflux transporter outer membrane subunit, partial [Phycisphaerae bacterium]